MFHAKAFKFLTPSTCRRMCFKQRSGAQGKGYAKSIVPNISYRYKKIWPNCPTQIHIVNEQLIDNVVHVVNNSKLENDSIIFEATPGPGLLTEALLKSGAKRVRVFIGDTSNYLTDMKNLEVKYHSNLEICYLDILDINKIVMKDVEKGTSLLPTIFDNIEMKTWNEPPSIKLIAPLSPLRETTFLRSPLFQQLAHKTGIFTCGRVDLFVFVSDFERVVMTSSPKDAFRRFRASTVLYNSLFDVEHLSELTWDQFIPQIIAEEKLDQLGRNNHTCHFMKLTPRAHLDEKIDPLFLSEYIFFVDQAFKKPKNYIVGFFEKWIPGCGPRLIKFGIPLFCRFGDLQPQEFFELYCELVTWEEFKYSNFAAAAKGEEEINV